jgi:hypothetical protein
VLLAAGDTADLPDRAHFTVTAHTDANTGSLLLPNRTIDLVVGEQMLAELTAYLPALTPAAPITFSLQLPTGLAYVEQLGDALLGAGVLSTTVELLDPPAQQGAGQVRLRITEVLLDPTADTADPELFAITLHSALQLLNDETGAVGDGDRPNVTAAAQYGGAVPPALQPLPNLVEVHVVEPHRSLIDLAVVSAPVMPGFGDQIRLLGRLLNLDAVLSMYEMRFALAHTDTLKYVPGTAELVFAASSPAERRLFIEPQFRNDTLLVWDTADLLQGDEEAHVFLNLTVRPNAPEFSELTAQLGSSWHSSQNLTLGAVYPQLAGSLFGSRIYNNRSAEVNLVADAAQLATFRPVRRSEGSLPFGVFTHRSTAVVGEQVEFHVVVALSNLDSPEVNITALVGSRCCVCCLCVCVSFSVSLSLSLSLSTGVCSCVCLLCMWRLCENDARD